MLKRSVVCLALALVWWGQAPGAERPTAEAIRAAAAAAAPAVVDVEVKGRQLGGANIEIFPDIRIGPPGEAVPQPPGGHRWEWQWPPRGGQPGAVPELPEGLEGLRIFGGQQTKGAGIVLSVEGERGLVAVPASLVAGNREATVRLADGRELKGTVLGSDKLTGTACVEIHAAKLSAAKPAKPGAVQVGDWVLAVGGPASGRAVSIGIVSATDRPGTGEMAATRLVHTDAFVSDMMAGGPLVTLDGQTVGMTLGGSRGRRQGRELTAVVPVPTLQATVAAIAREGRVRRGFLGITFAPLTREERERLGIQGGVKVQHVVPGQPAANAGMQQGDVIVEFAGKKVAETDAFRAMVAARKPGETVAIKILRGGEERFVEVTLGEQADEAQPRALPPPPMPPPPGAPAPPLGGEKVGIGLSLQPLTPELAEAFGFRGDKGLLVTAVEPGSPVAKGRPQAVAQGDLIKEIGRKPVATVAEARKALEDAKKAKAKSVLLLVRSRAGTRYIVVDLPR